MSEVKEVFDEMSKVLSENPSFIDGLEAVYQINLNDDEEGVYQIVFKEEGSYTTEGEEIDPECTLTLSTGDFIKMVNGELNGTQAFMSGKLKIKGNMGLALKLQNILSSYSATTK